MNFQDILEEARDLQPELSIIRRTIHQNPEVGECLPKTTEFVKSQLKAYGYDPVEICESGITAQITGLEQGNCVLLRADMDGLTLQEKTGLKFQSQNGAMHACGHDMHTAMLLGAAKLLKEHEKEIPGTVKFVFQPAEETFQGAKKMLKAGVLQRPKVQAGIALHVNSGTPSGMLLCGQEIFMAGCTTFQILVQGVGCHGSRPETGIDPIRIAVQIYQALEAIQTRELSANTPVALTIGKFSGGEAANMIPQQVVMEGTIRCFDRETAAHILKRIEEISKGIASAFQGTVTVKELASAPPLKNDKDLTEMLCDQWKRLLGEEKVFSFSSKGMGSEDFASYTYEIPCSYLLLGAGIPSEDPAYGRPMHNEAVVFNEEILALGSAVYAVSAIKVLSSLISE